MTLKITRSTDTNELLTLHIDGRLTCETIDQLSSACAAALAHGVPVVLHLGGVAFADAAAVDGLRALEARGVVLVGCSDFVATLLEGAAQIPDPAPRDGGGDAGEEPLLQALRAGDAGAFELLVRRQTGPLLAAARRILNNEDDARDAVQETFVSAYRHVGAFGGDARLSTWLHRIVVNAALMKLRSRRRRPEESIDDLLPCFDENGAWVSGMALQPSSAEARIESRQTRELVQRCIARLPDSYRQVLVLRDIEDLDTAEVAAALRITANAVKIRLHRARQALRTSIEQERLVPASPAQVVRAAASGIPTAVVTRQPMQRATVAA